MFTFRYAARFRNHFFNPLINLTFNKSNRPFTYLYLLWKSSSLYKLINPCPAKTSFSYYFRQPDKFRVFFFIGLNHIYLHYFSRNTYGISFYGVLFDEIIVWIFLVI